MAKRKIKKTVSKKKEPNWKALFVLTFIVLIGVTAFAVYKTKTEAQMAEVYWNFFYDQQHNSKNNNKNGGYGGSSNWNKNAIKNWKSWKSGPGFNW
jgi:hypothetical protein